MEDLFRFADAFGPAMIAHIVEPAVGLKAVVAIDNTACGPSIGGVRMAADASAEEAFRLARAMTLKNAAAGLAHGGGKSVILSDPHLAPAEKEQLIRAFAVRIRDLTDYIPGPDMGTDETCMAWIRDEIGRSVGLPAEIGGIPLDEIGATGFGVAAAAEIAAEKCGLRLDGARIAVQGFGSVGIHAAQFLAGKGAVLVAAADSRGSISNPGGLDIAALTALKAAGKPVAAGAGEAGPPEAIIDADCDIWIPAARPDASRADNADRVKARLIVEGANIPVTDAAETRLHERGVLVVPDIIANAGGVICAAVEYRGGTQKTALETVDEKVRANTAKVLAAAKADAITPRDAARQLAETRLKRAMSHRRWS